MSNNTNYLIDQVFRKTEKLWTAIRKQHSPEEVIEHCETISNLCNQIADNYKVGCEDGSK